MARNSTYNAHSVLDLNISNTIAEIATSTPLNVTSTTANVVGDVIRTGGQDPLVTLYWGDEDGGNVSGNWDHNYSFGSIGEGVISHVVKELLPGTQNYFSFSANNNNGGTGGTSCGQIRLHLLLI